MYGTYKYQIFPIARLQIVQGSMIHTDNKLMDIM